MPTNISIISPLGETVDADHNSPSRPGMFKNLANRLLATYVDVDQVDQTGLSLRAKNLKIKPECLFEFIDASTPFKISKGKIETIYIDFNSYLVEIDGILIQLVPNSARKSTTEEFEKFLTSLQENLIKSKENEVERIIKQLEEKTTANTGWFSSITSGVQSSFKQMALNFIQNLKINVRSIHFVYQDRKFSLGMTLQSIEITPAETTENDTKNKRAKVDSFGLYLSSLRKYRVSHFKYAI